MRITSARGDLDHAWMDGDQIGGAEGMFLRLDLGDNEGLVCTEIHSPRRMDEATAERIAMAAVAAAEGRDGPPVTLVDDERHEVRVERQTPPTAAEVDGRIHRMTDEQLSQYGRLTPAVVAIMLAMLVVVPLGAAWVGWDAQTQGWLRYGRPISFALVAFIGMVTTLSAMKDRLDPDMSLVELGEQTIAADRERERRARRPRVVIIRLEEHPR